MAEDTGVPGESHLFNLATTIPSHTFRSKVRTCVANLTAQFEYGNMVRSHGLSAYGLIKWVFISITKVNHGLRNSTLTWHNCYPCRGDVHIACFSHIVYNGGRYHLSESAYMGANSNHIMRMRRAQAPALSVQGQGYIWNLVLCQLVLFYLHTTRLYGSRLLVFLPCYILEAVDKEIWIRRRGIWLSL